MGMEQSASAVVTYRHMLFGISGQRENWSFGYRVSTCVGQWLQVPGIMANKEETLFIKIRNDNFNERVVPLRRYA